MREIAFLYIVHLFINSCSIVMGNQAAQNEFRHNQQQHQQHHHHQKQLLDGGGTRGDADANGFGSGTFPRDVVYDLPYNTRPPPTARSADGSALASAATAGKMDNQRSLITDELPLFFTVKPRASPATTVDSWMQATTQITSGPTSNPSMNLDASPSTGRLSTSPPPTTRSHHQHPNQLDSSAESAGPQRPPATNYTDPTTSPGSPHHLHPHRSSATPATTLAMTTEPTMPGDDGTASDLHHQHKSLELSHSQALPQIKQHQQHQHLPKVQRTDAPMLNHIFDTYGSANKHHHHDHRYGPHFEDIHSVGNVTNITVQVGSTVYLNCRISLLQDKTVSWVRRKSGDTNLDLLTVGKHTYSGDPRYKIEFQYPNNWRLKIEAAAKDDEGTYECQISTHPPRIIQKNLYVNDPKVRIIDETGVPLQDKYYEVDSTLQLSCIVRHVAMKTSVVFWRHGDKVLNYDTNRGGVSVKTEIMEKGANSTLFIAKINKSDSGNYTCSINSSHDFTVLVHVLNGESFAELHHGRSPPSRLIGTGTGLLLVFIVVHYLLRPIVLATTGNDDYDLMTAILIRSR